MKIYYNHELIQLSRKLRKQGILSEVILWEYLKGRKVLDFQFMRQKPIGNYIVDFYCSKLKLAIEIDGKTHDFKIKEDIKRQKEIEQLGIKFLRFTDSDVRNNIEGVITFIREWIMNETGGG